MAEHAEVLDVTAVISGSGVLILYLNKSIRNNLLVIINLLFNLSFGSGVINVEQFQ
jgi:hypothetical protein